MSWFQLVGIGVSTLMTVLSLLRLRKSPGRRWPQLVWAVLWVAAGVAFVFPDGTTWIAQIMGIERGADMVMYVAVLAGIVGFWLVSLRLRAQARQITLLARKVALSEVQHPTNGPQDHDHA